MDTRRNSSLKAKGRRSLRLLSDGAMGIVGLPQESQEEVTREKWNRRRRLYLHRLSSVKPSSPFIPQSPLSAQSNTSNHFDFSDVVLREMSRNGRQASVRRMSERPMSVRLRQEHAGKLLWRTASQKMKVRPRSDVPTMKSYGGRSYLATDIETDHPYDRVYYTNTTLDSHWTKPYNPNTFFYFVPSEDTTDRHNKSIIFKEEDDEEDVFQMNDKFPSTHFKPPSMKKDKPGKQDINKSINKTQYRKTNKKSSIKREFGKGLVGRLLRRSLNRKIVADLQIREQMKEISDHRTYFTYWLSTVQIAILVIMLCIYPFAPIGVGKKEIREIVLMSDNGMLLEQKVLKSVTESFWVGPSLETLILLGAKYAPCMRRDKLLYETIAKEREQENSTGCCRQTLKHNGCIQRSRRKCLASFAAWERGTVCGQDPKACLNPRSTASNKWGKDITKWPVCEKTVDKSILDEERYPHMHCEVTGRPCCIGTQSQCVITSKNYCDFRNGIYHADKTLCSQVDCLSSTCGLLPFEKDHPNQFYRLFLSLFLNAGIFHVVINLIFNITILRDIEKMSGWYRTALIYVISGVSGNLWCAVLAPYEPEVGPSGAMFGIISCLFVEVIQGWQYIQRPMAAILKLCIIVLLLFAVGLLPYIDNFSHVFGFVHGFLLALIFLPYVSFGEWDRRRKRLQIVVALILVVTLMTVGLLLFYVLQYNFPYNISYFNCIPFTKKFCENFNHGQVLEERETIY